jgi:hypothetical protein
VQVQRHPAGNDPRGEQYRGVLRPVQGRAALRDLGVAPGDQMLAQDELRQARHAVGTGPGRHRHVHQSHRRRQVPAIAHPAAASATACAALRLRGQTMRPWERAYFVHRLEVLRAVQQPAGEGPYTCCCGACTSRDLPMTPVYPPSSTEQGPPVRARSGPIRKGYNQILMGRNGKMGMKSPCATLFPFFRNRNRISPSTSAPKRHSVVPG